MLLNVIADKEGNLLKQLVRSAMEFLNFVGAVVQSLAIPTDIPENGKGMDGEKEGRSIGMDSHESRLRIQSLIEYKRNASAKNSPTIHRSGGGNNQPAAWPSEVDPAVSIIYENFHVGVTQHWSKAVIQMWSAALWVLQLRFQCGLRVGKALIMRIYHI